MMWRMTWHNKSVVTIHATLKLIYIYIYIDYDTTYNFAKKIRKAF